MGIGKKTEPIRQTADLSIRRAGRLKGVKVKLHYALYDGLPCISKWFEIENRTGADINLVLSVLDS